MKVNIGFAQYVAVIEFEPFMGDNIEDYQRAFENWFFEEYKNETGGYSIRIRPRFNYKCFDAQVIIDWIKEVAPQSNPRIIASFIDVGEEDPTLPAMYF